MNRLFIKRRIGKIKRVCDEKFGFLEKDFRLFSRLDEDFLEYGAVVFVYEHDLTRVRIYQERNNDLAIDIEPIGDNSKYAFYNAKSVNIKVIARCLNPNLDISHWTRDLNQQADILGNLLETYCVGFLKGDFSEWAKIKKCLRIP
jgi:hypothetical protein